MRLIGHTIRAIVMLAVVCLVLIATERFDGSRSSTFAATGTDVFELGAGSATPAARGKFNGRLAFSSDRHNGRGLSIWTMNADGSFPTRLTDEKSRTERLPSFTPVYDLGPVWSPDGTRIAFVSNRDLVFAIHVMNADGSNVHLITDKVLNPAALAWSPDGTRIALSGGVRVVPAISGQEASVNIYVVNTDGTQVTKLTSEGINDSPTWSPDGTKIAFNSNRDLNGTWKIWVMNADGSNQKSLTNIHGTSNPLFYGDGGPVWSPDGAKILFNGSRDFNGTRNCNVVNCAELFVMNADGSNDVPLTNDPNRVGGYAARWSPDGVKIIASRSLGTIADRQNGIDMPTAIVVMNADGSDQLNLSNRSDHRFIDAPVDWQPVSSPASSSSSIVGFSNSTYSAYEDAGTISITVRRTGNLNDVASCFYATEDGTATITQTYAPKFDMLRFGPNETSKTISISLTDNADAMGNRVFKVSLFDNEGNATFLGGVREATVTVLDRDPVPRARNPIDDTRYFVWQHYIDFLNREPDPDGLAFWINQIESCGTDAQCRAVKRINVSAAFYLSIEFQQTGFFVRRVYELGGQPTSFFRDMQRVGSGVVVGQSGWQERLETNKTEWIQQLFDEDKVATSFGFTNEQYVDLLFQYAKVTPTPAERNELVSGLNTAIETRPGVFRKVVDDEQLQESLFNPTFVFMEYVGYLRRDPDDSGYNFWLKKLNQFDGNYLNAEMVKSFILSSEYRSRFGES